MNDPIKIIHKYKNNNKRIQYHTYIFVGNVPSDIDKILELIKDKQFYETLISLSGSEFKQIVDFYGDFWYTKLFNTYHIADTLTNIKNNKKFSEQVIKQYGINWFNMHVNKINVVSDKIAYSYQRLVNMEYLRKQIKKRDDEDEDNINIDYTTIAKRSVPTELSHVNTIIPNDIREAYHLKQQNGGNNNTNNKQNHLLFDYMSYIDTVIQTGGQDEEEEDTFANIRKEETDEEIINEEEIVTDEMVEEEVDEIFKPDDVQKDNNIQKTRELIKNAIGNKDLKAASKMIQFDTHDDTNTFDQLLNNVYKKYYVKEYYLFKDDNIKTIKNKICCSIENNKKFDNKAYIIPSRQYLWSEYIFNEKIEHIMIGQKWMRRNELLTVDIEPSSNISYYEELRGNLKLLRDTFRKYNHRIRREDDDATILNEYDGYYTNNEIYMIDIYNELGKGYRPSNEIQKNIQDIYVRIYFPKIKQDDFQNIIEYLNNNIKLESSKNDTIYETILNDTIMEYEIMRDIELIKANDSKLYTSLFKENYITHSVIHVNLRITSGIIDMYRIFNEFEVNDEYPFIQYQTLDNNMIIKYDENAIKNLTKDNSTLLNKWFENAPYGISFKIKIPESNERYMAINLNETGRIDYKTQWREEDAATVDDIIKTYKYIEDLVKKINNENNKVTFDIPRTYEYRYAFINSIQRFELPNKLSIDHNDLSDFCRYFYPYISLVVEPKKRESKIKGEIEPSKFGTYLRYKRVSGYDNPALLEQRILYYVRNYEHTDNTLANEISKHFNITLEKALDEVKRVKAKYPYLKKARKILKKLDEKVKHKIQGISIDIQGKQRENYKVRISGARNKPQLDKLLNFVNVLLYLYTDTYLLKNIKRKYLLEKLEKLTDIAKRRNKVSTIIDYNKEKSDIKIMGKIDEQRLAFKPEKGQSQWSRDCQNSGDTIKRRPQQFISTDQLQKNGFKLNKETGLYEKKIKIKNRDVIVRAVGLDKLDSNGNKSGVIYYTCNPNDNKEHIHIGFLSRAFNPFGQCMPCCFKKDQFETVNKAKKDNYLKCLGKIIKTEEDVKQVKKTFERIYILQDTNKIQDGRIGFLSQYLDYFMNGMMGNQRKVKQHYLIDTPTGYFFKYGIKKDSQFFLNAISSILNISINDLFDKMITALKNDILFTAINNGDIKTMFTTSANFISYLKNNELKFDAVAHFISLPSVISEYGLNIIVFDKYQINIKKDEKILTIDDYNLFIQNNEEINEIVNVNKINIILIRDNKFYYPVIKLVPENTVEKQFKMITTFKYENNKKNIIHHINDFVRKNDILRIQNIMNSNTLTSRQLYEKLTDKPMGQVIDLRNKVKYFVMKDNTIIPVRPSGAIYNLKMIQNPKILKYDEMINQLKKYPPDIVKPIGLYYDSKNGNKINIIGIMTENKDFIPIEHEQINIDTIKNLQIEYIQIYDKIDELISKKVQDIDERIIQVNKAKYLSESYELFRFNFAHHINKNKEIKQKIIESLNDKSIPKQQLKYQIRKYVIEIVDSTLLETFKIKEKSSFPPIIKLIDNIPENYQANDRTVCSLLDKQNKCNGFHCKWAVDKCYLTLTKDMAIEFINRVSEELLMNNYKTFELLGMNNYYVSDIVDTATFKSFPNARIIKSNSKLINQLLAQIFQNESALPIIGKRKISTRTNIDKVQELNITFPLRNMGKYYSQKILDDGLMLFRAFTNGYMWNKNVLYNKAERNLGYYSNTQTDLANYFRSKVIDWLTNKSNEKLIKSELSGYIGDSIIDFIDRMTTDVKMTQNGYVESYILSKIYDITIKIYDKDDNIKFEFKGSTPDINIKYDIATNAFIPISIEILYFKSTSF